MSASHRFATFWQGALSPLEAACIGSYVKRGYQINVYSYAPLSGLPAGVEARDARDIAPESALGSFLYAGKPNLSHFSDYFRYLLFQKTDQIWVDADMYLARKIGEDLPATILAREWQPSICGAIMRIGPESGNLDTLLRETEATMGKDLLWGETGPLLLTKTFGKATLLERAFRPERFYALDHDDFWKVFLPDCLSECQRRTELSWGIHLWNNIIDTLGYWKVIAPPAGSFLSELLLADDLLGSFRETYPEVVMRAMIDNFRFRKSGGDLGIKQITKQVFPSVGRTIRHYRR